MKKKMITLVTSLVMLVAAVGLTGCGDKAATDEPAEKTNVIIAGSTSVQPLSEVMAESFMAANENTTVEVQGGGSGQGIKAIEESIADIGSLSREVKDEEKASIGKEYVIAKDGVAMVVNKDTKVSDVTIAQLKDIYTGKIKNWSELGGDDQAITVVSREAGSGTRGAFTELTGVLGEDAQGNEVDNTVSSALVQPSTGAVQKTVASTPGAIGYVSLGSLDDTVKVLTVEKVEATTENVLSGEYKIQRPFVYVVGAEVSEGAQAFLDFAMGAEGQKLVEENGFIPVE